jgi:MinD superfamily P-loop ATPase
MKQIAVVSGKGGTGKTTFVAMLHSIEGGVLADCDVDAPNLHILLNPQILKKEDFIAAKKAYITDRCTECGLCYDLCRFDAIEVNECYRVDEQRCEGCALCYNACPEKAVEMREAETGKIYISKTQFGFFVHALLHPGEENSGRLVSEVKERARRIAEEKGSKFLFIDSAPGIGCPVISSLTGVDAAIVVTEPTFSGLSDLRRVIKLAEHFRVDVFVVLNKYDLNKPVASKIEEYCRLNGVKFAGKVPYDREMIEQVSNLEFPFRGLAAEKIVENWLKIKEVL